MKGTSYEIHGIQIEQNKFVEYFQNLSLKAMERQELSPIGREKCYVATKCSVATWTDPRTENGLSG